jgi:hypothetical protein
MKRSTKVSLVLMGAVGISEIASALPGCPQPGQGATAPDQSCPSNGVHGRGSHPALFSDFSGNSTMTLAMTAYSAGGTGRGGFGEYVRKQESVGS